MCVRPRLRSQKIVPNIPEGWEPWEAAHSDPPHTSATFLSTNSSSVPDSQLHKAGIFSCSWGEGGGSHVSSSLLPMWLRSFYLPSHPVPSSCLSCLTPTRTESDLQCQIPCRLRFWLLRDICCSQERKRVDQIEFLFSDPIRCTQLLREDFPREAWLSTEGTSKMPFVSLPCLDGCSLHKIHLSSILPMSFWDLNSYACQLKLLHEGGPESLEHPGVLGILGEEVTGKQVQV